MSEQYEKYYPPSSSQKLFREIFSWKADIFSHNILGGSPKVVSPAKIGQFLEILSEKDFISLAIKYPQIERRLVLNGVHQSPKDQHKELRQKLDLGYSIILNEIESYDEDLTKLCHLVWLATGLLVQINCFITPPFSIALPLHTDPIDGLVLQIQGNKNWSISKKRQQAYGVASVITKPTVSFHESRLERGDVLYLPSGWAHKAVTTGELSTHLTLSILEISNADILVEMIKIITKEEPSLLEPHGCTLFKDIKLDLNSNLSKAAISSLKEKQLAKLPSLKTSSEAFNMDSLFVWDHSVPIRFQNNSLTVAGCGELNGDVIRIRIPDELVENLQRMMNLNTSFVPNHWLENGKLDGWEYLVDLYNLGLLKETES